MVNLILCADDYGLNENINAAAIALVRAGRLNAVSCMTVGSALDATSLLEATADAPFDVQVGLHLTLTEYHPLGPIPKLVTKGQLPSVGSLLANSHLRRISLPEIAAELTRQFDAFERIFRRQPDFVDGHQHIHIFPRIRNQVISLIAERRESQATKPIWIRCCDAPTADLVQMRNPRAVLLAIMARRQRSELHRMKVPCNARFYGVNNFDPAQSFRGLMQGWLNMVAQGSSPAAIMCHPGQTGSDPDDPISTRRPDELAYLKSAEFTEDLKAYKLELQR